jgi:hypothetical protein
MNNRFTSVIENTLYKLNTTLADLGLSTDELYAYAKKYKFNTNELESFLVEKHNKAKEQPSKKVNLTEADYIEIIRRKKLREGAKYAESMVF